MQLKDLGYPPHCAADFPPSSRRTSPCDLRSSQVPPPLGSFGVVAFINSSFSYVSMKVLEHRAHWQRIIQDESLEETVLEVQFDPQKGLICNL